jgi:uncharacterized membrane protein
MAGTGKDGGSGASGPAPLGPVATGPTATGPADPFARTDSPLLALTLWPHRSLSRSGFSWLIGAMAVGLAVPLLPLAGSSASWALLPFLVAMLLGVYLAIQRNYADGRLVEELRLWPDLITVERREPRGRVRRWHANPFWVKLGLFENARIEHYLTLKGNGREIELGAFLSPEERVSLYRELGEALAAARSRPELA